MRTYTTLYLADDHQIVIDGLKLLIGNEDNIKIVGYSNDGETACAEIADRKPDLALIDFSMPKLNGLELIYTLRKTVPNTRFIILSMYDNPRDIKAAQNGGASGYILKNIDKTELMKCLNSVLAGKTYFPDLKVKAIDQDKAIFTPREIDIIKLILNGQRSAEIATQLNLSHGTVDTHRKNINRKTETNTPLGLNKFLQDNQIKL
jgi:two-component system, NarL family, nitrate/nitrite response regulator NarL